MRLIVTHSRHFRPVMGKDHLDWGEVALLVNGPIVADCQWIPVNGLQRAPDIDDLDPAAEKALAFILVFDDAFDDMPGTNRREVGVNTVCGCLVVGMCSLVMSIATNAVREDDGLGGASTSMEC